MGKTWNSDLKGFKKKEKLQEINNYVGATKRVVKMHNLFGAVPNEFYQNFNIQNMNSCRKYAHLVCEQSKNISTKLLPSFTIPFFVALFKLMQGR